MGIRYDYFAASSDRQAARALAYAAGPSQPAVAPVRTGLLRRPLPVFETLRATGIDPIVQMGTLEELLTGRSFTEVLHDPRSGEVVADRDDSTVMVLTTTRALQRALAAADVDQLRAVSGPWAATEEFFGTATGEQVLPFLADLAALARSATARRERLYCWLAH